MATLFSAHRAVFENPGMDLIRSKMAERSRKRVPQYFLDNPAGRTYNEYRKGAAGKYGQPLRVIDVIAETLLGCRRSLLFCDPVNQIYNANQYQTERKEFLICNHKASPSFLSKRRAEVCPPRARADRLLLFQQHRIYQHPYIRVHYSRLDKEMPPLSG